MICSYYINFPFKRTGSVIGTSMTSLTTMASSAAEVPVPTRREYFDDMKKLQSTATFLSLLKEEGGRLALVLDSTIFHPQGGGQPSDTGCISGSVLDFRFVVEDVRSKDSGLILHYGFFEGSQVEKLETELKKGQEVSLYVNEQQRDLNSRLHSAGHLLDICMDRIGLSHLMPEKGYHFPDGPFVEYKGTVAKDQLQNKQKELEMVANALISTGEKVTAVVLPYEEASALCGGVLPSYILKSSNPRIVRMGSYPGCPCGGTHVTDIADIRSLKVTQIRVKKGYTKVFYTIG